MVIITLTAAEGAIADAFNRQLLDLRIRNVPIPDEKEHEKLYANYIKILKKCYPPLHKSVIYLKYFFNVGLDTDDLEKFNKCLIAYASDPTDMTNYNNLRDIINKSKLFMLDIKRKFINIDKDNFVKGGHVKNIANIMATTEEIETGGMSLPDAFVDTL